MKKAIIVVSFGTTHADAEMSCIRPVEEALRRAFGGWEVRRAWTSRMIARRLAERGEAVENEAQALELNEDDARPKNFELRVPASDFSQTRVQQLNRILASHPGRDYVVLFVLQSDGRRFRAELPVTVDSTSVIMKSEIQDLFGAIVW